MILSNPRTLIPSGCRWLPQLHLLPWSFSGSRLATSFLLSLLAASQWPQTSHVQNWFLSLPLKLANSLFLTSPSHLLQPSLSHRHYYPLIVQARHLQIIFDSSWFLNTHPIHQCGMSAWPPEYRKSSIPSTLLIQPPSSLSWNTDPTCYLVYQLPLLPSSNPFFPLQPE